MNTKYLSISEGRKRIFEIAEEVQRPAVNYVLTEKGIPKVAIISAEYLVALEETAGVLASNAQLMVKESCDPNDYYNFDNILLEEGYEKNNSVRPGKKRTNKPSRQKKGFSN